MGLPAALACTRTRTYTRHSLSVLDRRVVFVVLSTIPCGSFVPGAPRLCAPSPYLPRLPWLTIVACHGACRSWVEYFRPQAALELKICPCQLLRSIRVLFLAAPFDYPLLPAVVHLCGCVSEIGTLRRCLYGHRHDAAIARPPRRLSYRLLLAFPPWIVPGSNRWCACGMVADGWR